MGFGCGRVDKKNIFECLYCGDSKKEKGQNDRNDVNNNKVLEEENGTWTSDDVELLKKSYSIFLDHINKYLCHKFPFQWKIFNKKSKVEKFISYLGKEIKKYRKIMQGLNFEISDKKSFEKNFNAIFYSNKIIQYLNTMTQIFENNYEDYIDEVMGDLVTDFDKKLQNTHHEMKIKENSLYIYEDLMGKYKTMIPNIINKDVITIQSEMLKKRLSTLTDIYLLIPKYFLACVCKFDEYKKNKKKFSEYYSEIKKLHSQINRLLYTTPN